MSRRTRSRAAGFLAATLVASVLVAGCTPPPQRKPIEMEPIGTVPNIPRTADDVGEGDLTTPNSGTPIPIKEGACTSTDFEDLEEALKGCEVPMPKSGEVPSGMRGKLDVRVTSSTLSTTPGGRVDLQVVLRNKSAEPLPLYFSGDPSPRFEVEAVDGKGRRVDMPSGRQPAYPRGHTPPSREAKAYKITLGGGGSARVKVAWDAVKTKWAPDKLKTWEGRGYPRAPAGNLGVGKYTLRVLVPLIGVFEKGELELPKVPIEVGS